MRTRGSENRFSRRGFLAASLALLALLLPLRGRREVRWYEVVQDMRSPTRWHVNLYSGPIFGDLAEGKLLRHGMVESLDAPANLEVSARIQYRDGRRREVL
ncbi:MAG: hypothetical protein HYU86_12310 [Chloroflexi bacterium]|nr:hypothetical protein [Chloroflexota bacterium]